MADRAEDPRPAQLAVRLREILGRCRQLAGGTNRALVGKLVDRGVLDVDETLLSKWRNYPKYGKLPKAYHLDALAVLIEEGAPSDADSGPGLAEELRTVCAALAALASRDAEPSVEVVLTDASNRLNQLFTDHPHSTLSRDTIALLQQAMFGEIEGVLQDPARVAFNLRYTIVITGDTEGWVVRTTNEADRVYPGREEVFVSFCSTIEALDHEYRAQSDGCIARELLSLDAERGFDAWNAYARGCECTLRVDSRTMKINRVERVSVEEPSYILRNYFDVSLTDLHSRLTPTTLKSEFTLPPETDQFPIHFNSYYCVGTTRITFTLRHSDYDPKISRSVFLPSVQSAPFMDLSDRANEIELETARRTVLAPGSGVLFRWRRP